MINEEAMILICREIDQKLNNLKYFNNRYADYSKVQHDYKEVHGKIKNYIAAIVSQKLGVDAQDISNFYEDPSFKVALNAQNNESNSIAGCFFVIPVESCIRIMNANYDVLKLNEEERKKAEACELQMVIKTTRERFYNGYSVTEKIIPVSAQNIAQSIKEFEKNSNQTLKNDFFSELTSEERRAASEASKAYIWEKFKEYSNATIFDNAFLHNWSDYKKYFKAKYGVDFNETDENGLSLWQSEGFTAADNRKIDDNGKIVTLEEQYRLSLKR